MVRWCGGVSRCVEVSRYRGVEVDVSLYQGGGRIDVCLQYVGDGYGTVPGGMGVPGRGLCYQDAPPPPVNGCINLSLCRMLSMLQFRGVRRPFTASGVSCTTCCRLVQNGMGQGRRRSEERWGIAEATRSGGFRAECDCGCGCCCNGWHWTRGLMAGMLQWKASFCAGQGQACTGRWLAALVEGQPR